MLSFASAVSSASWGNLVTDSEMPSTLGITLDAIAKLQHIKESVNFHEDINSVQSIFEIKNANIDSVSAVFSFNQYFAKFPRLYKRSARRKAVAFVERAEKDGRLHLNIADGWHVNAHVPLDSKLIPTKLRPVNRDDNF